MKQMMMYLVLATALASGIVSAAVNGEDYGAEKTLSPYFYVENGDPSVDVLPLKHTRADVLINGVIAEVQITQTYENRGTRPINAKYVFPASTRAAVHGLKMKIGDRIINAEVQERRAAEQTFEKAKRAGKSASLLSQERPNVFSMSVANIMPGDIVDIELQYTEHLIPEEGVYEFVYPAVVGPRYSSRPESTAPETDRWIKNPYLKEGETPDMTFDLSATLSCGVPVKELDCPSHPIQVDWKSETVTEISLNTSKGFGGDRDFILNYRLTGEHIQSGLMLYEGGDEKFFLLTAQPPERVAPEAVPPREYIFVVDVSGSMNGFPLNVSKRLLKDLIGGLRPIDTFNVILFAAGSTVMADRSAPATPENIAKAINVIDRERGNGGTRLLPAVKKAMNLPGDENTSRSILIITDGYISAEREVFQYIRRHMGKANVFAFGIGSGVNRFLIEGIARAGYGEPFVVIDKGRAPAVARRFQKYIESPVLTNIRVEFDGFDAFDIEPSVIPDMFAERPVVVYGKYRGEPGGAIRILGVGGDNEFNAEFKADQTAPLEINRALKYLWARKRIQMISDHYFEPQNQDRKSEITSIGLTYNLMTEYTSFVAVLDDIRNTKGSAKDVTQPLPMPRGVPNSAVGVSAAKVPEPELSVLIALAALAVGLSRYRKKRAERIR